MSRDSSSVQYWSTPHPRRWIRLTREISPNPFGHADVDDSLTMVDRRSGQPAGPKLTAEMIAEGSISKDGALLYVFCGDRLKVTYDMESGQQVDSAPAPAPASLVPIAGFVNLTGSRIMRCYLEQRRAMGPQRSRKSMLASKLGQELLRIELTKARTERGVDRAVRVLHAKVLQVLRSEQQLTVDEALEIRCLEGPDSYLLPDRFVIGARCDALLYRALPGSAERAALLLADELNPNTGDEHGEAWLAKQDRRPPDFFIPATDQDLANFELLS